MSLGRLFESALLRFRQENGSRKTGGAREKSPLARKTCRISRLQYQNKKMISGNVRTPGQSTPLDDLAFCEGEWEGLHSDNRGTCLRRLCPRPFGLAFVGIDHHAGWDFSAARWIRWSRHRLLRMACNKARCRETFVICGLFSPFPRLAELITHSVASKHILTGRRNTLYILFLVTPGAVRR